MVTEYGYLDLQIDDGYLEGPYLGGEISDAYGMQVNMVVDTSKIMGMETEMVVNASLLMGMQAQMIVDTTLLVGMQVDATALDSVEYGMQVEGFINDTLYLRGMQVKADTLRHALHGVYLEYPYLEDPYLVEQMCAFMGMQVTMQSADNTNEYGMETEMVVNATKLIGMQTQMVVDTTRLVGMQTQMVIAASQALGMQTQMVVDTTRLVGMQTQMVVNKETQYGMQVDLQRQSSYSMEVEMVIYNITQLRLMWEFPSRGTAALLGLNWTATSTAAGDFSVNNVNTDIVEQVWRSSGSPSSQTLTCDTGVVQGVSIDTIAILGHNFTTSAQVQVQGSQDNFATPPSIVFDMLVERNNMYYIAPAFPSSAGQNRYWRFVVQDSTNPAGYLQVGTIIFGTTEIFSTAECFINPIPRGYKHFKDTMPSEGFTTVSNDRALKKFLRLSFEKINYFAGNFRILDEMMQFARTSLKILVIPTPEYPSRFAVFGKLVTLPEIVHTSIDATTEYIDVAFEWDESL